MKRLLIFMSLCAVLALSACSDGNKTPELTAEPVQQTEAPTPEPTASPNAYIYASATSQVSSSWTEVKSFSYDMDGDGVKEKIRLMTSAKKDSKGRLVIDDSHDWALEMQDNDEVFTLLNEKISNGCPYFEVSADTETNDKYLRVLVSSSAKFVDKNYKFLKDKRAFIETDSPETQNTIYSSLPYYE